MQETHSRDAASARHEPEGRVVHLMGRLTESTFGLLGPATAALSQSSVEQTVVFIDDPKARAIVTSFDDTVHLVPVQQRNSTLAQWRDMNAAYNDALDGHGLSAVHLHGFTASLVARRVLHKLGTDVPVFYSPHASRSIQSQRMMGTLAQVLTRPFLGPLQTRDIANGASEAKVLQSLTRQPAQLVEAPVDDAFIGRSADGAKHPLIVTANQSANVRAVELFAELAVLLGGDALHIGFNWLGTVDALSQARLIAANVGVFDAPVAEERAARLSAGWVFVALAGDGGYPFSLVEAMAVGLPCVAIDIPSHRDLVRHGETGYLCNSRGEIIDRIAQLIDTPSLRQRMGFAATTEAVQRFSKRAFFAALRAAYNLPPLPGQEPAAQSTPIAA